LKKQFFILFVCLFWRNGVFSQNIDCKQIPLKILDWETRLSKINTEDPELIPLHYLFLEDIQEELDFFRTKVIPHLSECKELDYYTIVSAYDNITWNFKQKMKILSELHNKIDSMYYSLAIHAFVFHQKEQSIYYLLRSLQYNPNYPPALLLQNEIYYEEHSFDECVKNLQLLFQNDSLTEMQENQILLFNTKFYKTLYDTADSLLATGLASDALKMFTILENFCTNVPSNYCNNDYFHGLLKSRKGIYDSYITIAKVARERGAYDIEKKFLQYAEEYLKEK
jgi:hypothetical protein